MVAERDETLSFPARHIFNRILSMRARINADIGDVFPLPWPKVRAWTGLQKDQSLIYLKELEETGYVRREGVVGCPPTRQIRITAAMASKGGVSPAFKGRKNPAYKAGENPPIKGRENPAHLIYSHSDKEELREGSAFQGGAPVVAGEGYPAGSATAPPEGKGLAPEWQDAIRQLAELRKELS